uniref:Uncharacterized protein n=1 Tax=Arundo donax TaxID=35708 RepID=A0A0A9C3F0_ARUDO
MTKMLNLQPHIFASKSQECLMIVIRRRGGFFPYNLLPTLQPKRRWTNQFEQRKAMLDRSTSMQRRACQTMTFLQ